MPQAGQAKEGEMPRFRVGSALALVVLVFLTSGCSTMRGAPKALVSRSQINGDEIVKAEDQVRILLKPQSSQERNGSLLQLMALADMRYEQYKTDLVNGRRGTRAGSGALTLFSDVAATLTNSVGVKNNYIALSALIDGGEAVFDNEYLFDKTIDSLISRMDADRKAIKVVIYQRLTQEVSEYSGQSALADVLEYFHKGTLNSALVSVNKTVQAQADVEQKKSEEDLEGLISPTAIINQQGTMRMHRFVESLDEAKMEKLRNFLIEKGISVPQDSTDSGRKIKLKQRLSDLRREYRIKYKNESDDVAANKAENDVVVELEGKDFVVPN